MTTIDALIIDPNNLNQNLNFLTMISALQKGKINIDNTSHVFKEMKGHNILFYSNHIFLCH